MNNKNQKSSIEKRSTSSETDQLTKLKATIGDLEQELHNLKQILQPYQSLVYQQLQDEIKELAQLSQQHKKYKSDKKKKRLEQKKRGKNYMAPTSEIQILKNKAEILPEAHLAKLELKKLYKEAIIKIHPDKISHKNEIEETQKATDLTAQLNSLYKNGDLDELKLFYFSISEDDVLSKNTVDKNPPTFSKDYQYLLIKSHAKLLTEIEHIKNSSYYYYHAAGKKPEEFIVDLRESLLNKIKKLKKRTKHIR